MRAVIQRVSRASVIVEGALISKINIGMLVLIGIEELDQWADIQWLSRKIANLRIFDDADGIMNRSVLDIDGEVLIVSQFTLHASTKKGNRPSYIKAAKPDIANQMYAQFVGQMEKELQKKVGVGIFGANMQVELVNNGPVTILIDTMNKE